MTNENESDEKMPSSLSPTAIKSMTVAELKRHLKRRDLNCQGLKATLAQRLLDFYNTEKDDDDDDDANDDDDDDAPTRRTTTTTPQLDLKEEAKRKAEDAVARFEEENNNKNKNDVVVPPNDEGRRNKKRRRNNGGESRRTVQTLDDDDDDDDEDPGDDDDDEKTAAARGGRRQRGGGKTRGSRGGGGGSKGGSKEDATKEKGDDEGQPEYECMYSVPCPGNEGRIIGKRGQKIRELQAKYGVVMQMNREKVTVEIMGDRDKVRECEAEVVKIIEDGNVRNMEKEQRQQQQHHQQRGGGGGGGGGGRREENRGTNHQKEEIPCSGMEGRIIGRGGETIHRLEAESGARVRINRDRLVCEISGEPGRVQTAVRMVHELMARGDSRTGGDGGGNQQGGQQSVYGQAYGQQQQQQQQQFGQPAATTQVYGAASTYGQPASSNAAPVYGQQPQTYGTRQVYGQEAPSSSAPVYGQQVYGAPQTQVQRVAPPPAPSSSLPPDWEEVNQGGQIYYWNTRTNLTQYERPV